MCKIGTENLKCLASLLVTPALLYHPPSAGGNESTTEGQENSKSTQQKTGPARMVQTRF